MDYRDINDYEIVYRIRENYDDDAVRLMIKKYEPIICSYAKKYINFAEKHGAELDDLIQEGRVAVAKAIKTYNPDKTSIFYTYVTICIERRIISYCRNLAVKKNSPLNYCVSEKFLYNLKDNSFNLSNYVINSLEEEEFLLRVKSKFKLIDSSVFELRYNGFSYREIGVLLDISLSSVESRLCKIRRTLQAQRNKF